MFDPSVHVKYFIRCLGLLPSRYESEDSNRLALTYFCICALDLLNALNQLPEKETIIDWIYTQLVEESDHCGFRGSDIYRDCGSYDVANLAATGFALQILVSLGDDLERLDKDKVSRFVDLCQRPNGSFSPIVGFGEDDLRYCMLAMMIKRLLRVDPTDSSKLIEYIHSTLAFDGGLSMNEGAESHAGLTYCGLSALKLAGKLEPRDWVSTIDFLVHRQVQFNIHNEPELQNDYADPDDFGGFNGRENKYADTCYAFWCVAALELLNESKLVDRDAMIRFLLSQTLSRITGGFTKTNSPDEIPDPFHSFLGIAVLGIVNQEKTIANVDVAVVLRKNRL
ncbi:hypothetical protein OGAPHI_007233 [Ogataea philodendri]|uniref:Prenyltransferase alpha-alpha toroid domain-containing protein n=1 Tax=Ogataea philodendri TaxID=1378263 RepID=A0A9P8NUC5_9ASCO|nr:uncharacterized protein OGAPHI_007233 [Ogataea philodendri]KAH3660028.1 hypothetical protein OGAPHI_007233 [Ogataea philodendri]